MLLKFSGFIYEPINLSPDGVKLKGVISRLMRPRSECVIKKQFSHLSTKTYVLDAQKNPVLGFSNLPPALTNLGEIFLPILCKVMSLC